MELFHQKRDGYQIKVNTSGISHSYYTDPPVFGLSDNDPLTEGDTIWTKQSADLDPNLYGNKQVYLAIHHNANNMSYLFIDNICLVNYHFTTGIIVDEKIESYHIFPNPTTGILNLQITGQPVIDNEMMIFDSKGAIVFTKEVSTLDKINISALPDGIYYVKLVLRDKIMTDKIVLNH
jgi:hypothetical protein